MTKQLFWFFQKIKKMKKINDYKNIKFERIWSMPNKNTFEILPIKNLINEEVNLKDFWIDPFANKNKKATVTNDLSLDYDTDYHMDALDFLKIFNDNSVDGVLYDPPYSPRQVSECYNNVGYNVTWDTTKASFWGNHKREISRIVKIGGKVITFGWNSGGIGYKYGFEIERILLVPHGGWHNDTICTVEVKTHDGDFHREVSQNKSYKKDDSLQTKEDKKILDILKKLPIDYWDFKNVDTKEYTHGLHNYPAVMVSPISNNIIKLVREVQPVTALLDPFSGSGTVLVEGMLNGVPVVSGNDINPLALLLTKVKTTPLDCVSLIKVINQVKTEIFDTLEKNKSLLNNVDSYITNQLGLDLAEKKGWGDNAYKYLKKYCEGENFEIKIPDFKNIGYWFRPKVILELAIEKSIIDKVLDPDIKDFILVAFSESIRLVSNRRNGEFKLYRMPKSKVLEFNPDVFAEFQKILDRNVQKMENFVNKLEENGNEIDVRIFRNNACSLDDVQDNKYDLIITSPPYGDSRTTVAYGEYSRLSLQWIKSDNLSEKEIISVDKSLMGGKKYRNGFEMILKSNTLRSALDKIKDKDLERAGDVYSFYEDLNEVLKTSAKKTKTDGYHFWVVGNRTVKNTLLQTDKIISELGKLYGLETVHIIDRNIPNKVMPSLNSPTNKSGETISTMTMEHIVILRKI